MELESSTIDTTATETTVTETTVSETPESGDSKKKGKKGWLIPFFIVLAIALGCLIYFLVIPLVKYIKSDKALNNSQYDEAYDGFAEISKYWDSETKMKESRYRKAGDLLTKESFDQAIEIFTDLDDYSDSKTRVDECHYKKGLFERDMQNFDAAIEDLKKANDYSDSATQIIETKYQKANFLKEKKEASSTLYDLYTEILDYKDVADRRLTVVTEWSTELIQSKDAAKAEEFVSYTKLSEKEQTSVCKVVLDYVEKNFELNEEWTTGESANLNTALALLNCTTETVVPNLKNYTALLTACKTEDVYTHEWIVANFAVFEAIWDCSWVQKVATNDKVIYDFLDGTWSNAAGQKLVYYDYKGEQWFQYSPALPTVYKPAGTKYYHITNLLLTWESDSPVPLAKVYQFKFIDVNTLEVYCFMDGGTYTLTR